MRAYAKTHPYRTVLVVGLLLVQVFALFLLATEKGFRRDERVHSKMIKRIYAHKIHTRADFENLTNIPGYHYTVAAAAHAVQAVAHPFAKHPKQRHIRYISATLFTSLFVVALVWLLRTLAWPPRTLFLVLTNPLVFLFAFVVYTDVPALALFLLATVLALRKRHALAALAFAATLAVRQDMVLYMIAVVKLLYWRDALGSHVPALTAASWRRAWRTLLAPARLLTLLPYAAVMVAFVAFVVWNGGVALGDAQAHPAGALHMGNIYFFLLTFAAVFAPAVVWAAARLGRMARTWRARDYALAVGALLAGWVVYDATFAITHPYDFVRGFLHCEVLIAIHAGGWARVLSYAVAVLSVVTLALLPWRSRIAAAALGVAGAASLALHWLIEPRYSMPLLLTVALLVRWPRRLWWAQLLWGALLCAATYAIFLAHDAIFL